MNLHPFQCGECGGTYWAAGRFLHHVGCPVPAAEQGLPPPVPGPQVLAWRRQMAELRAGVRVPLQEKGAN